jgi:hypothetical protein
MLRLLGAARIAGHVADAASRWRDADFPPRVRATGAVAARLGYSEPVVEYALDRLFGGVTQRALEATIAGELGSVEALDGAVERGNLPAAWARGVDRTVVISSDTTIGVALVPALFALCAKSPVVVKDRSDALIAAFFETLAEEDPAFASAAVARPWTGGEDPGEERLFATADTVVAFGRDETLRAVRARCGVDTRFVPFGHRASIGRLTAAAVATLTPQVADAIARDALLYDGEGCLSLHALFVEADDAGLERVADALAPACERVLLEFPPGVRSAARLAAAGSYRRLAAFRAASGGGRVVRVNDATLVVGASADDPPPFLPGIIPLVQVDGDDDVAAYTARHRLPVQALGAVDADLRDVALAERIGAVRVAPFGTMQDPPLSGHHGGAPRISDFIRWIDLR